MPSTKNTLIGVIMILISLLLILQFSNTTLFTSVPVKEESQGPADLPKTHQTFSDNTLRVDMSVSPIVFTKLHKLSQMFTEEYGIKVDLVNHEDAADFSKLHEQFKLKQNADVLLLNSEEVKFMAMQGMLLPNEQAVTGLDSGQDWLTEYTRWNGITWAVSAYIDPYVMVWNEELWKTYTGTDYLPQTWLQWRELIDTDSEASADQQSDESVGADDTAEPSPMILAFEQQDESERRWAPEAWFAWDGEDEYAFLSLMWRLGIIWPDNQQETEPAVPLQGVTEQDRTEGVERWQLSLTAWTPYRSAFKPLDRSERDMLWDRMERGQYMFAIVPYSEAMLKRKGKLVIEQPHHILPPHSQWIRSQSYVVAANTELEREAVLWISHMTQSSSQLELMDAVFLLPADRNVREQSWSLMASHVPLTYANGHKGLQEALHRTSQLGAWSQEMLKWLEGNEEEGAYIKTWNRLWNESIP